MDIRKRLKDLREDNDMTQQDLADIMKLHKNSIWNMENGNTKIPHHQIIQMAKLYKVSTDYLLGLTDDPKGSWLQNRNR